MRLMQCVSTRPVVAVGFGAGRLVAGSSGGYEVLDLAGGETKRFPMTGTTTPSRICVVDPRGRWFYCADHKNGCRLLPLDEEGPGRLAGDQTQHHIRGLAVSADGGRVFVSRGVRDNRVECWEVGDPWRMAWAFRDGEPCDEGPFASLGKGMYIYGAALSPDGRRVGLLESRWATTAARDSSGYLVLRDAASGKKTGELAVETSYNYSTSHQFTHDGKRLVVCSPKSLSVWDVAKRARVREVYADRAKFLAMAVHPSGRFLATAQGIVVRLWHPETLRELCSFRWEVGKVHCLAFSEDGHLGAAGGDKGRVALWDVDD